ncbi:hypothetical protein BKP35_10515 [Anaerobacillus arseniciselenatis]|uniref:DUF4825 domain-containing protein n=1 Tax=Anaerobacillus arseniciselenatis TaxID=85682 RepID=A0A1S2LJC4_9BACI|nr:hypothetical protein [Anaerobacillus arseniciselenatis]OIJ12612.1 hypothetical protein BKP35_10515 [Anaerobacillus arseniciselenatis]
MRKIIITAIIFILLIGSYFGRGFLPHDQIKQDMLIQVLQNYGYIQIHIENAIEAYEDDDREVFELQLARAVSEAHAANRLMGLIEINVPSEIFLFVNFQDSIIIDNISTTDMEELYDVREKLDLFFDSLGIKKHNIKEFSEEYHPSSRLLEKIIQGFNEAGFSV